MTEQQMPQGEAFFDEVATNHPDYDIGVSGARVSLSAPGRSNAYFVADRTGPDNRLVKFNIRTLDDKGDRYPIFRQYPAHVMAARALDFFDEGSPLRGLSFHWYRPYPNEPSSNYEAYLEEKARLSSSPTMSEHEKRVHAALATWTMKRVAPHGGFNYMREITEITDISGISTVSGTIWRTNDPTASVLDLSLQSPTW